MHLSANKKFIGALALLAIAGAILSFSAPGLPEEKPDIVYITIDSLRRDHMGAYGYDKPTTPFLDSLLARGIVFERAYAPGYLTFQSNAAVLSGLYPSKNNVTGWNTPLRADIELLPEILKLYGYSTGGFVSPSMWESFGFARGFDVYTVETEMKNAEKTQEKILNWMSETPGPHFAFWHIYDVHLPFVAAEKPFLEKPYAGPFASTTQRFNWVSQSTSTVPGRGGLYPIADADRTYLIAAYDTGIRKVDDILRNFYARLGGRIDLRNTMIIIASEHGEDLNEHGFMFHRDLYDVNVRVPLAVIYPARLGHRRIEEPVSLLDIMPTALSLAGIAPKKGIDGVDVTPLMEGRGTEHPPIFIERPPFGEYALIKDGYKYIMRNSDRTLPDPDEEGGLFFRSIRINDITAGDELYDLSEDPQEQVNVLRAEPERSVRYASLIEDFKASLEEAREETPPERVEGVLVPYFER